MSGDLPVFTRDELAKYDGRDGKPTYVAYQERVYDVSESKMWKTGRHVKRHSAGEDLTEELADAPHGEEVFERFTQVGILKQEEKTEVPAEEEYPHLPGWIARFLVRFPFFERHPHPMTVHFPIAFMLAAPAFAILYLITGVRGFDVTTHYMLAGAVLFSLVGILTGFYTWWVNYMARPVKAVTIKIVLASIALIVSVITFIWRTVDPDVLVRLSGINVLYLVLVLLLAPLVSVIGWYGATMTFPLPQKKKKEEK